MGSTIELVEFSPLENKKELKRFINLPWDIYKGDSSWTPPLRLTVLDSLDTKKNPFYKHAEIKLWNAYLDGALVGRISGTIDQRHNEFHNEKVCFWGFFECINDQEVAQKLFTAVENWGKQKGMVEMRGPANPSFNHEAGLQVSAFDRSPYIMMTHNKSYYSDLVSACSYTKVKDLYAFEMERPEEFEPKIVAIAHKVMEKGGITFRTINMKKFTDEVLLIQDIYNDAWEKNWGFVPMDDAEFKHMAKSLKDIIWPELCLIAEIDSKPIGFSLSLPDINQVLKEIPSGKLLPFGIFKLLSGLKPENKKINQVRVITLGVKQAYRATGVASVFYYETYRRAGSLGVKRGECSWILEDNKQMLSAVQAFSGQPPYKTYRVFGKVL